MRGRRLYPVVCSAQKPGREGHAGEWQTGLIDVECRGSSRRKRCRNCAERASRFWAATRRAGPLLQWRHAALTGAPIGCSTWFASQIVTGSGQAPRPSFRPLALAFQQLTTERSRSLSIAKRRGPSPLQPPTSGAPSTARHSRPPATAGRLARRRPPAAAAKPQLRQKLSTTASRRCSPAFLRASSSARPLHPAPRPDPKGAFANPFPLALYVPSSAR